jgi:hypothetical protein
VSVARDVVVMVRQGRQYEELRYALRSLANLPHGRVWVYGGQPNWLAAAAHVPVRQGPVAHVNTARITAAIAANRALSDEFYWFHDDMYILAPTDLVPRLYRCPWDEWLAGAAGRKDPHGPAKTNATAQVLAAFDVTPRFSYELHIPMVVDRDALREMVSAVTAWRPEVLAQVQKRSLYGNWVGYGGTQAEDVKFYQTTGGPLGAFASSTDTSLNAPFGQQIRDMFPDPSPYERPQTGVPDAVRLMAGHLAGGPRG